MNRYAQWFQRVVWIGIVANLVLAVPGVFFPNATLALAGQLVSPPDALWISLASLLLVILSIAYMPAAWDPFRYRANAWLAVFARLGGVVFFVVVYPGLYPAFGLLDLTFLVVELPLLLLAFWRPAAEVASPEPSDDGDALVAAMELPYEGSTFDEVKQAAFSGAYAGKLPRRWGLTPWSILRLCNDSARNLAEPRDVLPPYDKLLHANGICYAGVWRIDQESPYTGYFKQGSEGLCLARFSVAGPFVKRGLFPRACGMAGKVFPTMDPQRRVKPANFVAIDHLSGTWTKHFTRTEMTNAPSVGLDPLANLISRVIFRLMDARPRYRQLHPLSTLGRAAGEAVVTPELIMLKAADDTAAVDEPDFRNELRLENYPGGRLVYTINVKNFAETGWTRLGTIEFTAYAISAGGDKRLHFPIPRDVPGAA